MRTHAFESHHTHNLALKRRRKMAGLHSVTTSESVEESPKRLGESLDDSRRVADSLFSKGYALSPALESLHCSLDLLAKMDLDGLVTEKRGF
ncbi:hypothetical protein CEXT_329761 [Caerostris extrusa]|uniref:Uncharacterized protein n=1 Tax=Caerostris extrusa TaxID=172846 RepID=A0AAV4XLF0_CAEEX|nr:hypothetical protein CEXT_329761 [Caerostris extrusa]